MVCQVGGPAGRAVVDRWSALQVISGGPPPSQVSSQNQGSPDERRPSFALRTALPRAATSRTTSRAPSSPCREDAGPLQRRQVPGPAAPADRLHRQQAADPAVGRDRRDHRRPPGRGRRARAGHRCQRGRRAAGRDRPRGRDRPGRASTADPAGRAATALGLGTGITARRLAGAAVVPEPLRGGHTRAGGRPARAPADLAHRRAATVAASPGIPTGTSRAQAATRTGTSRAPAATRTGTSRAAAAIRTGTSRRPAATSLPPTPSRASAAGHRSPGSDPNPSASRTSGWRIAAGR